MRVFELFSQRQARLSKAGQADVYQFDTLPNAFRVQVCQILDDAFGTNGNAIEIVWDQIHSIFVRQKGVFRLHQLLTDKSHRIPRSDSREECLNFILASETDGAIDFIDFAFHWMTTEMKSVISNIMYSGRSYMSELNNSLTPGAAVTELNYRLRQHGIGYQFEDSQIIRVDSQYIHAESVVPTLRLLSDPAFSGPDGEFRESHRKYRMGDYKGAVVAAENAFESTIKVICDKRRWAYPKGATAANLVQAIWDNHLIPEHLDDQKEGLRSMLKGLSIVRNKCGAAHGGGSAPVDVTESVAAYCLHLAAANILFLVEQHKALP